MAAMGPSERAQFLSRVLGYERLRAAQTLVREQPPRSSSPRWRGCERHARRRRRVSAASPTRRRGSRRRERAPRRAEARRARRAARAGRARRRGWTRAQEEREQLQELLAEMRVAESEEATLARDAERVDA